MLTWISEQAKWVVYIFIVFIVMGLLFMDLAPLQTNDIPPIAKVNGEEVSAENYASQLDSRLRQNAGQQMTDAERSKLRRDVFENMVRGMLLRGQLEDLELVASGHEMHADLIVNPPQGIRQNPQFFGADSTFDQKKYEAWLTADSTYNNAGMRQYENYLASEKIPMQQLQALVGAGHHLTNLETQLTVARRETKAKFAILSVPTDSFTVAPVTEEQIKSEFETQKDSFFVKEDLAKLNYITLAMLPSAADEENAKKYADFLINQIKDGADFGELARSNSEDKGSATKDGRLGFSAASAWVKPFATAAFALKEGEISAPVKSQFGYHVIKSHGQKTENGEALADVSHILIKVSPGTETVDSLRNLLEEIKAEVIAGKAFAEVAKTHKIDVKKSSWASAKEGIRGVGFLRGLSAYAFHNAKKLPISDVLENDRFFALAETIETMPKGSRNLERFSASIKRNLESKAKLAAAKEYLSKLTLSESLATSDPKVSLDSSQWVSVDSYLPKVGFGTEALQKFFTVAKGAWSSVEAGDRNAVAAKLLEKTEVEAPQLDLLTKREKANVSKYAAPTLFGEWIEFLKRGAHVEDMFYVHYRE